MSGEPCGVSRRVDSSRWCHATRRGDVTRAAHAGRLAVSVDGADRGTPIRYKVRSTSSASRKVHRMVRRIPMKAWFLALAAMILFRRPGAVARASPDPLPAWNDGPAKSRAARFLPRRPPTSPARKLVPPAERIATFDNDGTLWVEHPMYTRAGHVRVDRVEGSARRPTRTGTTKAPFDATGQGRPRGGWPSSPRRSCSEILAATHAGMTEGEFRTYGQGTGSQTERSIRLYSPLIPNASISRCSKRMSYLRGNGFRTRHRDRRRSGDFVRDLQRAASTALAREQVTGSAIWTEVHPHERRAGVLLRLPALLLLDDEDCKPEDIDLFIGL